MNTYELTNFGVYRDLPERVGEPFKLIGPFPKILNPFAVTLAPPLGEDLTTVDTGHGRTELRSGYLFAAVLYRERHMPLQLGEFFIPDLMVDNYWFEIRRNFEKRNDVHG